MIDQNKPLNFQDDDEPLDFEDEEFMDDKKEDELYNSITKDGSSLEVTANAEQIPSTCTKIGLFLLRGPKKACFAFADNAISLLFFILNA